MAPSEIFRPNTPCIISARRLQLTSWQPWKYATSEVMFGPNGVPGIMSAGAFAATRLLQRGHVPLCTLIRVVTGLIGGTSM